MFLTVQYIISHTRNTRKYNCVEHINVHAHTCTQYMVLFGTHQCLSVKVSVSGEAIKHLYSLLFAFIDTHKHTLLAIDRNAAQQFLHTGD